MNKVAKCTVCKKPVDLEKPKICAMCDAIVCAACALTDGQQVNLHQYVCEKCLRRMYRSRNSKN